MKYFCILFFLAIITSCATLRQHKSKVNPAYKGLNTYGSDTLKYITHNFYDNQVFYINKPLDVLFKDLETKILYYTIDGLLNPMDKADGVTLAITYTKFKIDPRDSSYIAIPTVVKLTVEFNELYLYDDALNLRKIDPDWGKAQEDFYKKFTIKKIYRYIPETE